MRAGGGMRLRPRREWKLHKDRGIWQHLPTGLAFTCAQITTHGWQPALRAVGITQEWRQMIAALPATDMRQQRDALLIRAMSEHDEGRLRQITQLYALFGEEANITTKGEA